jgi:hypothetical protein
MKTKILFIFSFAFSVNYFFAQSSDGKYTYQNEKGMTCSVTISEGGWKAAVVLNLGKSYNGKVIKARGDWFKINRNAVEPDYNGPEGWYQVSDGNCNIDFDEPGKTLKLNLSNCENLGIKDKEIKFSKK